MGGTGQVLPLRDPRPARRLAVATTPGRCPPKTSARADAIQGALPAEGRRHVRSSAFDLLRRDPMHRQLGGDVTLDSGPLLAACTALLGFGRRPIPPTRGGG